MHTTKNKAIRVTSWAGVDSLCVKCGKPADHRWKRGDQIITAACKSHRDQVAREIGHNRRAQRLGGNQPENMNEEIPYNPPGMDDYIREGARKNSALLAKLQRQSESANSEPAKPSSLQQVGMPPRCPHCNGKMEYEDSRDDDGNLDCRPWWRCEGCGHCEGVTDAELVQMGVRHTGEVSHSRE